MKILILHRVPYYKIDYHRGINHLQHEVTYIGTAESLKNIPSWLPCRKIERLGLQRAALEVLPILASLPAFDRVISVSEYELEDAAIIRDAHNIPGMRPLDVAKVRDKVLMKKWVSQAGVACPRNIRLSDLNRVSMAEWSGKTVLKPIDGASSQDVTLHESIEAAKAYVESQPDLAKKASRFEIEDFIEGRILHFDGIIAGGELKCFMASAYIGTCLDYAKGKPLGSYQRGASVEDQNWVRKCLQALNLRNSAFHLEAIESEKGLVFLEVGARVGGADVVDTFELATGIHLPSEELKLHLELPDTPTNCAPIRQSFESLYGWFVYPGHHLGKPFQGMRGFEPYRDHSHVVRWQEMPFGNMPSSTLTYQAREVPLSGVIRGSDENGVRRLLEQIFSQVN